MEAAVRCGPQADHARVIDAFIVLYCNKRLAQQLTRDAAAATSRPARLIVHM